jgi:hypothetical protein
MLRMIQQWRLRLSDFSVPVDFVGDLMKLL